MGDSKPEIELQDAVDDFESSDLLDAVAEFDEESEISSVVRAAATVGSARYILSTSDDDEEAPEVICELTDEFPDEEITRSSRSIGHGLRPIRQAQHMEAEEDTPNVVVRIDI